MVVDPTVDSANPTLRLQPLLWGINATALRLVGGGKIDGQGPGWWPYKPSGLTPTTADQLPPYFFECYGCDQLYLGDITIEDCPFVCAHPKQAHDVHIRGVNISNPIDSPNTDCVDPDSLIDTVIEDSTFACGDDHISVKAITQHTSNLVVQNCTFLHGQGMTIGSKVLKGMTNITWRDSVAIGALTGIRLKGIRSQGGVIENLLYENIHFRSVGLLMTIDLDFHHEGTVSANPPVYKDITLRNITAWGAAAGQLNCLPESPCKNVVFDRVLAEGTSEVCLEYICNYVKGECVAAAATGRISAGASSGPTMLTTMSPFSPCRRSPRPRSRGGRTSLSPVPGSGRKCSGSKRAYFMLVAACPPAPPPTIR